MYLINSVNIASKTMMQSVTTTNYYDSLKFANITASLSTTKHGGRKSCPELQEVEDIMHPKIFTK